MKIRISQAGKVFCLCSRLQALRKRRDGGEVVFLKGGLSCRETFNYRLPVVKCIFLWSLTGL